MIIVQPLSNTLLRDHAEHAVLVFNTSRAIQTHDVPTHTPYVVPIGIKESPPTVRRRRWERDAEKPGGQEDRRAYNGCHRIQRVHGRLKARRENSESNWGDLSDSWS